MNYGTTVSTDLDPQVMVSLPDRPELQPVADDAGSRLQAAPASVGSA